MFDSQTLGNRVLLGRRQLGFDQEKLARKSGVSRSRISEIERGRGTNVGVDTIYGLAQALDVTVSYLLGLTEDALSKSPQMLRELNGESLVVNVESREQRRLLQDAIDALTALSPGEQRRVVRLLQMIRQVEKEESMGNDVSPRMVG